MHDGTGKAHLQTGLGGGVERVVVAVKAVQQSRLLGDLVLQDHIRLLVLGRREVLGRRALRSSPVALSDVEAAAGDARVDIAIASVNQRRLGLNDGTGTALVVDAENLGSNLELLASGCGRDSLDKLDLALAIDTATWVKLGHSGNSDGLLGGIKVYDFLAGTLESYCAGLVSKTTAFTL